MNCRPLIGYLTAFLLTASRLAAADPDTALFSETFDAFDPPGKLPADWTFFSTVHTAALDTERAHSGSHALKLVDASATEAVGIRTPHIPVKPGHSYIATWWHFGEVGQNQALYLEFWDQDGKRLSGNSFSSVGEGLWARRQARALAPADSATLTAHFNSYSTNQATGWFDDLTITPSTRISQLLRKPYPPADVAHPCGLYRADDVQRARENLQQHAWARDVAESLKREADFWMGVPDEKLTYWIPELTPFRVLDCPKCGAGWRFGLSGGPDKLDCRKCGLTWPNDDYPEQHSQTYPDPVGGTQTIPYYKGKPSEEYGSAKSEVYRFSGRLRYNRLMRLRSLGAVGKVYALTNDLSYAQTVRRVLLRLAEAYPHYLPHDWNRIYKDYSNLQSGKLCGWKLTDAGIFIQLATAYDLTYNSGVYSDQDKVAIEEGCFREFARLMTATSPRGCCINDGPTAMGAGALAGLMLGDHDTIAWAIEPPDGFLGFIETYFVRDGHWYEASPSYEGMSIHPLYVTPEALRGYSDPPDFDEPDRYDNLNLLGHPLMKKMLVASAHCVMPDGHLPPTNDSTWQASYSWRLAEKNLFWNPTEKNRRILAWAMGASAGKAGDEYALFRRDPDVDLATVEPYSPSADSIIQPGVGWAILRTGDSRDDAAVFLDFGPKGSGHGHPDRLNIIYYDRGAELVTDLGYLGWGHPNHPWIRSTASHNQVIVDGEPHGAAAGVVEAFSGDGGPVQGLIASAPRVYGEITDTFRRHLIIVNHGPGQRYLVDLFEVQGGNDHQYAFHGDGELFNAPNLAFNPIDTESLGNPKTGYEFLTNTRQADTPDAFTCTWIADPDTNLGVTLHMLGQEGTQLVCAEANGLRDRKTPFAEVRMHPIYVRRKGPDNRFLGVIEALAPARTTVNKVTRVQARAGAGWCDAVAIHQPDRTDIAIIASPEAAEAGVRLEGYPDLISHARMALITLENDIPKVLWALDGKGLQAGTATLDVVPTVATHVTDIDEENATVTLDAPLLVPQRLAEHYLLVDGRYDGAYLIADAANRNGHGVITLANDPVIKIPSEAPVRIVSSASLQRLSAHGAALRGDVENATWTSQTSGPRYARSNASSWHPAGRVQENTAVTIAASDMQGRSLRLAVSEHNLAKDSEPPRIALAPEPTTDDTPDSALGYSPELKSIRATVTDDVALADNGVTVTLTGARQGKVTLDTAIEHRATDQWELTCTLPDSLQPDEYTLTCQADDAALNTSTRTLTFNTIGIVLPFRDMDVTDSSGKITKYFDSLTTRFYRAEEPGDFVEFTANIPATGTYRVAVVYTPFNGYGIIQPSLDGKPVSEPVDFYAREIDPAGGWIDLGTHTLEQGTHTVRFDVVGKNQAANGCFLGVCSLVLQPQD